MARDVDTTKYTDLSIGLTQHVFFFEYYKRSRHLLKPNVLHTSKQGTQTKSHKETLYSFQVFKIVK